MSILLPGGAGYIGSHTAVELLKQGKEIVIVDNFSNSNKKALDAIKKITGKDFKFYEIDYMDREKLEKVFEENEIEAVMNFAGFKAVGESVREPLKYYYDNVSGAIILLQTMAKYGVKEFVFSSSATIYGEQAVPKYTETMERKTASSPYGTTKIMIEKILEDLYAADNTWKISILRYFNPVGAHESGLLGENPNGIPNNLMPYVQKVAVGELKELTIFGNDYNTKDGTCERDFLHVVDLAMGHIKALEKLDTVQNGIYYYNLGTGKPVSVLELVNAFMKVNNVEIPFKFGPRRAGDLDAFFADPTKAETELGWKAERTIEDMCRDSWNYIQKNK